MNNQITVFEEEALMKEVSIGDLVEQKKKEGYVIVTEYMHEALGKAIVMQPAQAKKMKARVLHFVRKFDRPNNSIEYGENNKPIIKESIIDFPLRFGFGSYNEPQCILNAGRSINVEDIREIHLYEEVIVDDNKYTMQG